VLPQNTNIVLNQHDFTKVEYSKMDRDELGGISTTAIKMFPVLEENIKKSKELQLERNRTSDIFKRTDNFKKRFSKSLITPTENYKNLNFTRSLKMLNNRMETQGKLHRDLHIVMGEG